MPIQTKITKAQEAIYTQDFKNFDKDGNGALTGDECQALGKFLLGADASDASVKELIAEIDRNADDRIELGEWMDKILGKGWVVIKDGDTIGDKEGSEVKVGRTYCDVKDVLNATYQVYDDMKKIPLVCAVDDEKAQAMHTFFNYAGGMTTLNCKALVGLAMNEGKPAAWSRIAVAAAGAMKAGTGNTLLLDLSDGAPDLCGIAKETGSDEEKTLSELFNATKDKPSDAKATFPALDVDIGDCRSDFRTVVVSKFLEEDIEDFFQWGQLPLDKCHLVVVNK